MKWIGRRGSSNVEDQRSGGGLLVGGGLVGLIYLLFQYFTTGDINSVISQAMQMAGQEISASNESTPEEDSLVAFVSVVLADQEQVWHQIFQESGLVYEEPKLVVFNDAIESGCGYASKSVGPFYCSADSKVYLDLSFFNELKTQYGGKGGDFAIAYVIGHEVGHHIQNLLGTMDNINRQQATSSTKEANELSVELELQADYFAGVWARRNDEINKVLEEGDIEEALSAASAVGDDHLQQITQGYVVPDAFTHGTSRQRMEAFMKGYRSKNAMLNRD